MQRALQDMQIARAIKALQKVRTTSGLIVVGIGSQALYALSFGPTPLALFVAASALAIVVTFVEVVLELRMRRSTRGSQKP
jgi:hypothetical protein